MGKLHRTTKVDARTSQKAVVDIEQRGIIDDDSLTGEADGGAWRRAHAPYLLIAGRAALGASGWERTTLWRATQ